ncbi:MAG TPA: endo-1,4-beta-xylanase [Gemmataceae bacterium]|nr:endo-1,4-beta-xylanase [Gemmataceae bacterium]
MGAMQFLLPPGLSGPALDELKPAYVAGGQDNMPYLSQAIVEPGKLRLLRKENESGNVLVPWNVDRAGLLMNSTATLIEQDAPYLLALELARGKVNQLRNQMADWMMGGLNAPLALPGAIRETTLSFARAAAYAPAAEALQLAQTAMTQAYATAEQLVDAYIQQVFQFRHQRQPRLETALGCRLGTKVPSATVAKALTDAFNTVCLPLNWGTVEVAENDYHWEPHDHAVDWAVAAGYHVVGGPLLDWQPSQLPAWLTLREKSLAGITSYTCNYAATVVKRYRGRVRTWQLTAGTNSQSAFGLNEDETLWLTLRIAEAMRQADPHVELVLGLAQPWGEYMASQPLTNSPFVFADKLIRTGLNLAGLNLELVMGVRPRGSYCRDILDASRIMDLYSLLGVPLHITLGFPSDADKDAQASPDLAVNAGRWRSGYTPEIQAEWAEAFARLALCKPAVKSVLWTHLDDAEPHLFPGCGLVNAKGDVQPALARLGQLRAAHLR